MLRKFKISVDGTQYLVEMEEVGAPTPTPADAAPAASAAPAPAPAPAAAPAPAPAPEPAPAAAPAPVAAGSQAQTAPMPGTILDIHVKVGDVVTANQPVMVLEAMKMENPVTAHRAGIVTKLDAEAGATVTSGAVLCEIVDPA